MERADEDIRSHGDKSRDVKVNRLIGWIIGSAAIELR